MIQSNCSDLRTRLLSVVLLGTLFGCGDETAAQPDGGATDGGATDGRSADSTPDGRSADSTPDGSSTDSGAGRDARLSDVALDSTVDPRDSGADGSEGETDAGPTLPIACEDAWSQETGQYFRIPWDGRTERGVCADEGDHSTMHYVFTVPPGHRIAAGGSYHTVHRSCEMCESLTRGEYLNDSGATQEVIVAFSSSSSADSDNRIGFVNVEAPHVHATCSSARVSSLPLEERVSSLGGEPVSAQIADCFGATASLPRAIWYQVEIPAGATLEATADKPLLDIDGVISSTGARTVIIDGCSESVECLGERIFDESTFTNDRATPRTVYVGVKDGSIPQSELLIRIR